MNAEYKIANLDDFTKIPPDRLDACLADFSVWLRLFRVHAELNAATSRLLGGATVIANDSFIWVDDGIVGVTAFSVECEGETLGRLSVGGK